MMAWMGALMMQADDNYPYLTFETTDGAKVSVNTESLKLTINGTTLTVGDQQFTLTNLSKMYFTQQADLTGISNAGTQEEEVVEVFTTRGVKLGKYLNINEAKTSLKPGLYILKSKQKSFKIVVK